MSAWMPPSMREARGPSVAEKLELLERPPMDLARDANRRAALMDEVVSSLKVLELRELWDAAPFGRACGAQRPRKDGLSLRASSRKARTRRSIARCVSLVVEDSERCYDAAAHVPREVGLQMAELGWPEKRDDPDAFFIMGYTHASACVTLALAQGAAPECGWKLLFGQEYAVVVGNLSSGSPCLLDLTAGKLGFDPRDLAKRVLSRSRFLVLDGDGEAYVDRLLEMGVFRKRRMPTWAPVADAAAFEAAWTSGRVPDVDRWGAAGPSSSSSSSSPEEPPRAVRRFKAAASDEWTAFQKAGAAAFGFKSVDRRVRRAKVEAAAKAYTEGLDLCGNQPLVWGVPTKLQKSLARSNRSRFG